MPTIFTKGDLFATANIEAFAVGTPVIGNTSGAVIRGQLERSEAGAGYDDERSFLEAVKVVGEERAALSKKARAYGAKHQWPAVIDAWLSTIARISRHRSER